MGDAPGTSTNALGGIGTFAGVMTWPMIRIEVSNSGVRATPSTRPFGWIFPTYSFRWDEVESVTRRNGLLPSLQFKLSRAIMPDESWIGGGLSDPIYPQRELQLWLSSKSIDRLKAAFPPNLAITSG